jgi:hypothetical protein
VNTNSRAIAVTDPAATPTIAPPNAAPEVVAEPNTTGARLKLTILFAAKEETLGTRNGLGGGAIRVGVILKINSLVNWSQP